MSEAMVRNAHFRERVTSPVGKESKTKQSFKEDADAKAIVRRWRSTGALDHVMRGTPTYGDFSNLTDYQDALSRITAAEDEFFQLPAAIRDQCKNDPGVFIDWICNPEKADELREFGLEELADRLHGGVETPPEEPALPVEPSSGNVPVKEEPKDGESGS